MQSTWHSDGIHSGHEPGKTQHAVHNEMARPLAAVAAAAPVPGAGLTHHEQQAKQLLRCKFLH
jgi:hypothetical protein